MLSSVFSSESSTSLTIIISILATTTLISANPQRPLPPPDACYRRNDTLPACPYGGRCYPNRGYTCLTACLNYQTPDSRFWCNVDCNYPATTLRGEVAPNPLFCIQPNFQNNVDCDSGWACYRRYSARAPLYRTQGPVCSPQYASCSEIGVEGVSQSVNDTSIVSSNSTTECSTGSICLLEPRIKMAKQLKIEPTGICAPMTRPCTGKTWNECGETEDCVPDSRCKGKFGQDCGGFCVKILGPAWGSYNATVWTRTALRHKMC